MNLPPLSEHRWLLVAAAVQVILPALLGLWLPLPAQESVFLYALLMAQAAAGAHLLRQVMHSQAQPQTIRVLWLSLALSLAIVFVLHPHLSEASLLLLIPSTVAGSLRGARTGFLFGLAGAAGLSLVVLVQGDLSPSRLISLTVVAALLPLVGGFAGQPRGPAQDEGRTADERHAQLLREELEAMVSHDIKSPLGTIISALLILRDLFPPASDQARQALNAALRASERQRAVIEDLLDVQRLRRGTMPLNLGRVEVVSLLPGLVRQFEAGMERKAVRLETHFDEALPAVRADPQLLARIISHLLDNTHKFTPANGRLSITASPVLDGLRLTIADLSPGGSTARRRTLLAVDQQLANGEAGASDRTALALAMCKLGAEAQGGAVEVGPTASGGVQVAFTLPLADAPHSTTPGGVRDGARAGPEYPGHVSSTTEER